MIWSGLTDHQAINHFQSSISWIEEQGLFFLSFFSKHLSQWKDNLVCLAFLFSLEICGLKGLSVVLLTPTHVCFVMDWWDTAMGPVISRGPPSPHCHDDSGWLSSTDRWKRFPETHECGLDSLRTWKMETLKRKRSGTLAYCSFRRPKFSSQQTMAAHYHLEFQFQGT